MSTSSASVECGVAVVTFWLSRSPGNGLSFCILSLAVAWNDTAGKTEHPNRCAVYYLEAHPPSSSIHLSVMGCCSATLHIVLTSSHNSTKVTVAAMSVISMSLNEHIHRKCQNWVTLSKWSRDQEIPHGIKKEKLTSKESTAKGGIHPLHFPSGQML